MNNFKSSQNQYPKGVTSLLVVTGLALVFVVMITGLTVLSVRQSRQAQDTDLSNRAIAAAESTLRDAAQLIIENPNIELPKCDGTNATGLPTGVSGSALTKPQLSSAADNKTSVVCRTITSQSDEPSGFIKKDESAQIFTYLPTHTGVNRMVLRWGKESPFAAYSLNNTNSYRDNAGFPANSPALVELSLIYWPKSGAISDKYLPVKNRLIVPTSVPTDFSTVPPAANYLASTSTVCDNTVVNGYNCQATINLDQFFTASGYNVVVKLRPRYKDTNYQAQFYNATSPTAVQVKSSRALIDVTTRVGDLYRRIQASMPLENNSFFDDVLYSNGDICKNLQVDSAYTITKDNNCTP